MVGATPTASNQTQTALNWADKRRIGRQEGSSRICTPGGQKTFYIQINTTFPQAFICPQPFLLVLTPCLAGPGPGMLQGKESRRSRSELWHAAGAGMQNRTPCVGSLHMGAQHPARPGRGSRCAETFASRWDAGWVAWGKRLQLEDMGKGVGWRRGTWGNSLSWPKPSAGATQLSFFLKSNPAPNVGSWLG